MVRCVVRLSLTYALWLNGTSYRKTVWRNKIELPDRYSVVPIRAPYAPIPPNGDTDGTPTYLLALRIAAKPLQLAAWLLLTAYRNLLTRNALFSGTIADLYGHLFSQNRGRSKKLHVASQYGRHPSDNWVSWFTCNCGFSQGSSVVGNAKRWKC